MFDLNQKGSYLFKPAKFTIYVGAQIETADLSTDELRKVIARTEKIVRDFADHGIIPGKASSPAGRPRWRARRHLSV